MYGRVCHFILGLVLLTGAYLLLDAQSIPEAWAEEAGQVSDMSSGMGHGEGDPFAAPEAHGGDATVDAHGAADAHGGGHGESSAGLPQLDVSTFPGQLFWLAVTFGILFFIFSKKSLPEISSVLENRQQHIQSDLETAGKLRTDAEKAQQTYEAGLEKARTDAAKAVQEVNDKIKAKAEKQNEAFRKKSEEDIQGLEKRLAKAKEDAMDDMNTIAAEVASAAAKKIVGIHPDVEQAKAVVKSINVTKKAKAA